MKKLFFLLLVCGLVGFSSLTAFAQQCDKSKFTPIQCGYYDEGYQDGANDAKTNRDNNYRRYRNKIDSNRYESFYRDGYDVGFKSIRPFDRWDSAQRNAYDKGYQFGDDDRSRRISRLPARYEAQYDRTYEAYYQKGYFDGYDNKSRQYDTPLGSNQNFPTLPNPNRPVGTNAGTISWSGRVDNQVNIVIQGNEIRNEDLTRSGFQKGYQYMNGVLPRRPSVLSVRKLDGRGSATVIQQPARANDYTAIVRISDPKNSDDNYRLTISWQANTREEPYQSGKVRWKGRVDHIVNIAISGKDVQSQDASQTGLSNVNFNINGFLARRVGTVSVKKMEGRGTVTILQQPDWDNDFTAIIQIFDPNRSDDEYEFEVTW